MSADRRKILEQVAAGDLTPEEADALLTGAAAPPVPAGDVRSVKIAIGVGGIDVTGDPSVSHAEIEGPHRAEIDGDCLVVRGELDPDASGDDSFTFSFGKRSRVHVHGLGRGGAVERLRVRMNPALALDTQLDAGPLTIRKITGPIRARVAAGPITIEEFVGPLDISVNAGAVRAIGRLTDGESRIRSDAGAVRVILDPTSSVRILAQAALGKVVVPGASTGKGRFTADRREAVIGSGQATLRVETAMGSVHVSTGDD